jgi:hypothetical protein
MSIPLRDQKARHTHGLNTTVVTCLRQAFRGEPADQGDVRLLGRLVVRSLECTLVCVAVVALRMVALPSDDLIGINPKGVVIDPRIKPVETLLVVVAAHAGIKPIVPIVHATHEVVPFYPAVGEVSAPMKAPSVHDGMLIIPTDHHEVHVFHESPHGLTIGNFAPSTDCYRLQFAPLSDLDKR